MFDVSYLIVKIRPDFSLRNRTPKQARHRRLPKSNPQTLVMN